MAVTVPRLPITTFRLSPEEELYLRAAGCGVVFNFPDPNDEPIPFAVPTEYKATFPDLPAEDSRRGWVEVFRQSFEAEAVTRSQVFWGYLGVVRKQKQADHEEHRAAEIQSVHLAGVLRGLRVQADYRFFTGAGSVIAASVYNVDTQDHIPLDRHLIQTLFRVRWTCDLTVLPPVTERGGELPCYDLRWPKLLTIADRIRNDAEYRHDFTLMHLVTCGREEEKREARARAGSGGGADQ